MFDLPDAKELIMHCLKNFPSAIHQKWLEGYFLDQDLNPDLVEPALKSLESEGLVDLTDDDVANIKP